MSSYKVAVIGAGIAGLSACVRLLENGIKNIVLIEASDRIGGRINTIPYENKFIEIGAQWAHGTEKNPVYDIAKSLDLVDESIDEPQEMFYATQDGSKLDPTLVEKVYKSIEQIIDGLEDTIGDETNESFGSLLDNSFQEILDEYSSEIDIQTLKGLFKASLNNERFESSCDDLHQLSALGWNQYEKLEGNQFTKFKYGYSKVIEFLRSRLDSDMIKLNEIVENIDYSDLPVKITSFNKSEGKRKIFEADQVICTIPLGCLKMDHFIKFFEPELPEDKLNAIEKLGFGCVNKIFVIFDGKFEKDFQGLQIVWREDLEFELEEANKKWKLDKSNEFYKAFDNFDRISIFDNVLLGFVAGKNAEFTETLDDECLLDIISELIAKCFPDLNIPKPKKIIRSKWHSNPFSRGSYSFIRTGSTPEDMDCLAEPIENRLYFAGEGTISQYAGTVHGAFISGMQAADKIIESLQ